MPDPTSVALDGWPGEVGREVEYRERPRELVSPVSPVPLTLVTGEHRVLPAREVGVA